MTEQTVFKFLDLAHDLGVKGMVTAHTSADAVIRPGVDQSRREFTWLLDNAQSLVGKELARVIFRRLLNARAWPVDPANGCKVHDEPEPGCRHCGKVTPDRHDGSTPSCPVCLADWMQSRALYARNTANKYSRGQGSMVDHMAAYDGALRSFEATFARPEGECTRHEHTAPESTTRPSSRRPENPNKVWSTWNADGTEIVTVRQRLTGKNSRVRLVDPLDPLGPETVRRLPVDVFYNVHCEQIKLDPQDPAVAAAYLGPNSVPLPANVRSWRFVEPIDGYHGPYTSAEEAIDQANSWSSNLDDEYHAQDGQRLTPDPTRTDITYNAWRESLVLDLDDAAPELGGYDDNGWVEDDYEEPPFVAHDQGDGAPSHWEDADYMPFG